MNIKTLTQNNVTPLDRATKQAPSREVRSEESQDRDADGRREKDREPEKNSLSNDELKKVLDGLKKVAGVIEHNLSVRVQHINNTHFFIIEDPAGNTVRRMTTNEAWLTIQAQDQKTGQLLNKTL